MSRYNSEPPPRPSPPRALRTPAPPPRLLDQVRERIRYKHYSLRTEKAYLFWIKRFIRFHALRHTRTMAGPEIEQYLTHLATMQKVSASTHKQALAGILFLYREVLGVDLPWMGEIGRPRTTQHVPVVLSREEAAALLAHLSAEHWLIAALLYGAGLRLQECLTLRIKDIEFSRQIIYVRQGKGAKDRLVMLPAPATQAPAFADRAFTKDLASGSGGGGARRRVAVRARTKTGSGIRIVRVALAVPRGGLERRSADAGGSPATTSIRRPWRGRWVRPRGVRASPSASRPIRFVTPSPRIFWIRGSTFAGCRSCWDTRT